MFEPTSRRTTQLDHMDRSPTGTGATPGEGDRPDSPGCRFPFAGAASRGLRDRFDPIRDGALIPEDKVWKSSRSHLWMANTTCGRCHPMDERRLRFGDDRMNSTVPRTSCPWSATLYGVNHCWYSPNHLTWRSIIDLSDSDYGGAGGSCGSGGPSCGLGRDGAERRWRLRRLVTDSVLISRGSVDDHDEFGGDGSR